MEKTDPAACVLCGEPPVDTPRIFVRQDHDMDAPVGHRLALCARHAAELRAGERSPQQIIYDWATRAHGELYRNERLVLRPELRCLACNAPLPDPNGAGAAEARCTECGTTNLIGSALGHPVAVKIGDPAD